MASEIEDRKEGIHKGGDATDFAEGQSPVKVTKFPVVGLQKQSNASYLLDHTVTAEPVHALGWGHAG